MADFRQIKEHLDGLEAALADDYVPAPARAPRTLLEAIPAEDLDRLVEAAIERIVGALSSDDDAVALTASELLLDHAFGKPTQPVEVIHRYAMKLGDWN